MKKLIYLEDAIEVADAVWMVTGDKNVAKVWQQIKDLPSAQSEIIRCKDCKYWRDDHTCHEHSLVSPMCANEYCSRAERRDDDN